MIDHHDLFDYNKVVQLALEPKLVELAKRLFWWKSPEKALQDQNRFLIQVMTIGNWEDVVLARQYWGTDEFRKALIHPVPGVFDVRSWSYWHRFFEISPIPTLPQRFFS